MICLCVTSLHLALSRLEDGLSIYSRNVVDPGVEFVRIVSPLDKIFGSFTTSTRLYHSFDDVCVARAMLNRLYLLFVKFPYNFLPRQVFKNIRRRIRRIERSDGEYFLGPRRLVSLLENSLRLFHTNGLTDIISPPDSRVRNGI